MELYELLQQIGFKDKKARVYLACLELDSANAQEIAKKANVERTSIYAILESLKKDGLVISTIKKKTQYFIPESPNKLIDLLQNKTDIVSKFLPMFLSLYSNKETKPKILFYEGKENIKEILNDTLKCQEKQLRDFGSVKDIVDFLGETFLTHYLEKRVKNNIKVKSLRVEKKELDNWYFKASNKKTLRTTRFLPKEVSFDTACLIYDNKVALISSKKENFGFIIESQEFSQMMKTLYDLIWQISKPV